MENPDIRIIHQHKHPDQMRLPKDLEKRADMHNRWTHENNINSREYDGWSKVQGNDGVIRNGKLILMHKPLDQYRQDKENLKYRNQALMRELGGSKYGIDIREQR